MSNNQPKVNFRPGDWEMPTDEHPHPNKIIALVEGATTTSTLSDGTTRTITFRKDTVVTLVPDPNNPRATWDPSNVITDTTS